MRRTLAIAALFLAVLLGFLIPFVLAWAFRRRLKRWLKGRMEKKTQKKWGAIVGGIRSVCTASALVIAASLGSGGVFQNALTKGSVLIRIAEGIASLF